MTCVKLVQTLIMALLVSAAMASTYPLCCFRTEVVAPWYGLNPSELPDTCSWEWASYGFCGNLDETNELWANPNPASTDPNNALNREWMNLDYSTDPTKLGLPADASEAEIEQFIKTNFATTINKLIELRQQRCNLRINEQLQNQAFGDAYAFVCGDVDGVIDSNGDGYWNAADMNVGYSDYRCCYSEEGVDTACSDHDTPDSWCISMYDYPERDPATICEYHQADLKMCQVTEPEPGGYLDPHFMTFGDEWFDFHGACDLVLVDMPDFDAGAGITIHVRTTARYDYSYIESAAIKIGEDVFQVSSYGQHILNGVSKPDMPAVISDYPVTYSVPREHQHKFVIDLGHKRQIIAKVFKDMVTVTFAGMTRGDDAEFLSTVGLLGHWKNGIRLARDGVTVFGDPNEYGQEWQVRNTEPQLFMTARQPQYPNKCDMPDLVDRQVKRRRLGEAISAEDASVACAHVNKELRNMCIFDVIATNDLTVARSGVY